MRSSNWRKSTKTVCNMSEPRTIGAQAIRSSTKPAASNCQDRLDQIVGNWGRFEPRRPARGQTGLAAVSIPQRPAGPLRSPRDQISKSAGRRQSVFEIEPGPARFIADRIERHRQLAGAKGRSEISRPKVADWDLALTPRLGHADRRITVATPLEHAGVYLVTAKLADGNISRTVVWLEDLAMCASRWRPACSITWPTPPQASRSRKPSWNFLAIGRFRLRDRAPMARRIESTH